MWKCWWGVCSLSLPYTKKPTAKPWERGLPLHYTWTTQELHADSKKKPGELQSCFWWPSTGAPLLIFLGKLLFKSPYGDIHSGPFPEVLRVSHCTGGVQVCISLFPACGSLGCAKEGWLNWPDGRTLWRTHYCTSAIGSSAPGSAWVAVVYFQDNSLDFSCNIHGES